MRSLLFAPGNRPEVLAKLPRSSPSAAVIDLEDAVPADRKVEARAVAHQVAPALVSHVRLFVRVNAPDTIHFLDDMLDGLPEGLVGVVVPKLASTADVDTVVAALDAAGLDLKDGTRIAARAVIDARGIESVVKDLIARGEKI